MQILGNTGGGRIGALSLEQTMVWLANKDPRTAGLTIDKARKVPKNDRLLQNLKSSIGNVLAANGGATSGGGNTRFTYLGDTMYHESNGAGHEKGFTIFYVKRPGEIAKIFAVGYHIGAQTYELTWKHHDWSSMRNTNQLSLDK